MNRLRIVAGIAPLIIAAGPLPSTPDLGVAAGRCARDERGPSFIVTALGLKDRGGRLRLEVYPPTDGDFLADDNQLIGAGKTFRRVDLAVPPSDPIVLCVRVPRPGAYTLSLLHDRNGDRKFTLSTDGIGFPNNPRLGLSKPKAATVTAVARSGPTPLSIRLNYRRGLLSFGPLAQGER